ncbi:MAG: MerR family transcriptional regulator [Aerococcus viridans]|uniref:MerR family transcriptional regulator n=1 Tax=Aerococcus agrisoli TaxID=2487350 RepID=A0A3N4GDM8_9LACT|nr:MerR family transcriptional regulator [Aerococcus agrisoli]OYW73254.1 MAG: MerR family transcriptional regulator [Aerococcus viridans]RPA60943.1 MerR family transcriptional regulator [Aerococcus agrisoli]
MKEKELRRTLAVFPIGTVVQLTDLTPRQIRYYEEQKLIKPKRSETNRRMYSLNDVDRLLEIKDYLNEGMSIQAIYNTYNRQHIQPKSSNTKQLTDEDVRRILYNEILNQGGFRNTNPDQDYPMR